MNNLQEEITPAPYIRVKVSQKELWALALVDSGNTCSRVLVSEEFFHLIGGEYLHRDSRMLSTAKQGSKGLEVTGQMKPVKYYFEGMSTPFTISPWVVRGLSHPMNIGLSFLQEKNVSIHHYPEFNELRVGGGAH